MAQDRKVSRRGGVIPELGVNRTGSGSFPANLYDTKTGTFGNPYASSGCGDNPLFFSNDGVTPIQRHDQYRSKTEDVSVMGRVTAKINDNFNGLGNIYMHAMR